MRAALICVVTLLVAGCASMTVTPRSVVLPEELVLVVPWEGAFFPPRRLPSGSMSPPIIVVRSLDDIDVVKHESGHSIYDAAGVKQPYP